MILNMNCNWFQILKRAFRTSNHYQSFCVIILSSLLQLLNIKQSASQSTRDFLSVLRVEAHRVLLDEPRENREHFLVNAFINGLYNEKFSCALQYLEPKTLKEAYEMIKNERIEISCANNSECLRSIGSAPDISSLMAVIKKMQWEIDNLKRKLSGKYLDNS